MQTNWIISAVFTILACSTIASRAVAFCVCVRALACNLLASVFVEVTGFAIWVTIVPASTRRGNTGCNTIATWEGRGRARIHANALLVGYWVYPHKAAGHAIYLVCITCLTALAACGSVRSIKPTYFTRPACNLLGAFTPLTYVTDGF